VEKQATLHSASFLAQQHAQWIRQFLMVLLVFLLTWLLHLVPYILPATRSALLDQWGWYPIYIPISIMIYWLGLKGYLLSRNSPLPEAAVAETPLKATTLQLPSETVEMTIARLKAVMQADKLYLDPELTVDKVAKHVKLPAKTVSFVLNQHLQKSFNTFVNEYRIEAVKTQLTGAESGHLTIAGVAFTCGFNSQATFQRTFKQFTGMSPTQYLSRQVSA
jgi:AraC-like DNA-binding protein